MLVLHENTTTDDRYILHLYLSAALAYNLHGAVDPSLPKRGGL